MFSEFTENQRSVFCVFSGQGVVSLRRYLNSERAFAELPSEPRHAPIFNSVPNAPHPHLHNPGGGFDDVEADAGDDEDGLDDGTEMVIDTQPLLNHNVGVQTGNDMAPPPPPPPTQGMTADPFAYVGGHLPYVPQQVQFHNGLPILPPIAQPQGGIHDDDDDDMEEFILLGPANGSASTATLSSSNTVVAPGVVPHQASAAGPSLVNVGASTAPTQAPAAASDSITIPRSPEDFVQIQYSEGNSPSPTA